MPLLTLVSLSDGHESIAVSNSVVWKMKKFGERPQNISHAVMSQRHEDSRSLDDFPTPPWATRALMEYILDESCKSMTCLEPACGAGHMARALKEYFNSVMAYDVHDYGFGMQSDFTKNHRNIGVFDWVITNPPFRLAEEFVVNSLEIAHIGVAILARTVFIESVGRYNRIFQRTPPTYFAQFVERVPMVKGRLDPKASTATGYSWIVWDKRRKGNTELKWIPPCRRRLERATDYGMRDLFHT